MNNQSMVKLSNTPSSSVDQKIIQEFIDIAKKNSRVKSIEYARKNELGQHLFAINSDELNGRFSMGRIAASLHESKIDRQERLKVDHEQIPDIINMSNVGLDPAYIFDTKGKLPPFTRVAMLNYAHTLEAESNRAQCLNIYNYTLSFGETIADRLVLDHHSKDGALRAAQLMVNAGCANEKGRVKDFYGVFEFEDGSML